MAHIFVRNSLGINTNVKIDVNFPVIVTTGSEGEPKWLLEVATTYPSISGTDIRPIYINKTTAYDDLDEPIADAVSEIASQIDWYPLVDDLLIPFVSEYRPSGENVSINSNIYIIIKDDLPSAGIDISNMQVVLNNGMIDFDITTECSIEGDPFEYLIQWIPELRLRRSYNEEN